MKHSTAKKFLSVLLSLLMLLSVLGVAASAYDVPEGYVAVPVSVETAPDGLSDGDIWFDGHMYAIPGEEGEPDQLPEAYYNENEETLIVVTPNDEVVTAYLNGENYDVFTALHKVNEFDTLAFEGYVKLGVGKDSAGEDGYYLSYNPFYSDAAFFYNPNTKTIKVATTYFYVMDYVEDSEYYNLFSKYIRNVADPEIDPTEGFILVPYTAEEAIAAGEEGLYLFFDLLKLEGYDSANLTIEDIREILAFMLAGDTDEMTEEEAAEAVQAAEAQVLAMSDEEATAAFNEAYAAEVESIKTNYYGNIYYNPETKAVAADGPALGGVFMSVAPDDAALAEFYEFIYSALNTAPQVTAFTPAVAEGEDEVDVLDPSAIVVYAQADVNLLGATMTVAANVEITPEEIAKAESLPEMAGLAISKLTSFDITFSKGDSTNLQPSAGADVTIRMPVPEGYDEEKIAVFHIDGEGVVQKVASTISNGFILAKAAFGFSPYVVAQVEESQSSEVPEGFEALPFGSDGLEAGAYYFDIDAMVQDTIVNNQIPAEVATEEFKAEMKAAMLADLGTVYYNADTGAIHAAVCGVVTPEDDMYAAFVPYVKQAEGDGPQVDEAVEAVIAKIDAIGEVAYTAESKALIDDADEAYAALTDEQKANVINAADLTAAKETYAQLKAAAETPTDPTEPTTEPTNNKGGLDFFSKLLAWLTELFNMFIRWFQK